MIFQPLVEFRQTLYRLIGRSKDALFDLMDAVLTTPDASSFVRFSQNSLFRREWSSLYSSLKRARLPYAKLTKCLTQQLPTDQRPVLSGDTTQWSRPAAITLKERTYGRNTSGSIEVGHTYSTLAWVPESEGSWALPLRNDRLSSFETPVSKAAFQLKQVCRQGLPRPIATYDRAYGNAPFMKATAQIEADLLVRLPSNRCVWGAPPPYSGRGRPRQHGEKFKFNDPATWPVPAETVVVDDPALGLVQVQRWSGFHFRGSATRPMEILRVEVLQPKGRRRRFKPLWLAWAGQAPSALASDWKHYLRRFSIEHWYRLSRQRLHWTLPQLTTQRSLDTWTTLVGLMSWQLWLARDECPDTPLPWQSAQDKLSPGRVAQAFGVILAAIGTPAKPPKPRGKAPGAAGGPGREPKPRYPTVKKRASKRKKTEKTRSHSSPQVA